MYNRRILANIGLRYEDIPAMDIITKEVRGLLQTHNAIDHDQIILVHFNAWESSSLNLQVYCFTKTTNLAGLLRHPAGSISGDCKNCAV